MRRADGPAVITRLFNKTVALESSYVLLKIKPCIIQTICHATTDYTITTSLQIYKQYKENYGYKQISMEVTLIVGKKKQNG